MTWLTVEDLLGELKVSKKEELNQICGSQITNGFSAELNGEIYSFSYDVDNQQNFSDTMRLFENNMIDSIGWNAYAGKEKVRIQLSKEEFTRVYLAGVKHKTDCLTRLNDVLYPLVDAAENKETIARIYWDTGLPAEELELDESKTILAELLKLERRDAIQDETAMMTMMALMEISMGIK